MTTPSESWLDFFRYGLDILYIKALLFSHAATIRILYQCTKRLVKGEQCCCIIIIVAEDIVVIEYIRFEFIHISTEQLINERLFIASKDYWPNIQILSAKLSSN